MAKMFSRRCISAAAEDEEPGYDVPMLDREAKEKAEITRQAKEKAAETEASDSPPNYDEAV